MREVVAVVKGQNGKSVGFVEKQQDIYILWLDRKLSKSVLFAKAYKLEDLESYLEELNISAKIIKIQSFDLEKYPEWMLDDIYKRRGNV